MVDIKRGTGGSGAGLGNEVSDIWREHLNLKAEVQSKVSSIEVYDESTNIGSFTKFKFIGLEVQAEASSTETGLVNIFIPTPEYASHWNTSDGNTGSQIVTENISRTTARISSPAGGEGTPFKTGGWANTDQDAALYPGDGKITFTTPGQTTGWGGDSTVAVTVYDADGTSVLETYTTPAITGGGTHVSGNITVSVTNFGGDGGLRKQAKISVIVDINAILGVNGGRFHVSITQNTDSVSDGSGPHTYTQPDLFIDANPTTPSISGVVSVTENTPVTKHISGIEYYDIGSTFDASVTGIDNLNENTARETASLRLIGTEYGLPQIDRSPFGTGSANFTGWTSNHDVDGVSYSEPAWTLNASSYRFASNLANITALGRDPWANGSSVPSSNASILVDTFAGTSTDLFESFDDEARREFIDGVGSGASAGSFAGAGTWVSTDSLITVGGSSGLVQGGQLLVPSAASFTDWSSFKPNVGGANPDYTSLTAPVNYGRRFLHPLGAGGNSSSMTFTFAGTFVGANIKDDMDNNHIEVYVYRIASAFGAFGPPPTNTQPLWLHRDFSAGDFQDGNGQTAVTSGIRTTVVGNVVNCSFGSFSLSEGIFFHIKINNPSVKISSVSVVFT